ncbi:MAG: hypothetical protein U0T32_06920 [Chitinophagales bacterium]
MNQPFKNLLFIFSILFINQTTKANFLIVKDEDIGVLELPAFKQGNYNICFWDQRLQVTDGSRPASWLGYARGGYGNVFGIVLESGASFTSLLTDRLEKAFVQNGSKVSATEVNPSDDLEAVVQKMMRVKADKHILIKMTKVNLDNAPFAKKRFMLTYLEIYIYDQNGQLIKKQLFNQTSDLSIKKYQSELHGVLKTSIYNAFNQRDVIEAINGGGVSLTPPVNTFSNTNAPVREVAPVSSSSTNSNIGFDIIVTKTGEEIEGTVEEISATGIKYKKKEQPNGPVRIIEPAKVFMIKYKDGTKEVIK